LQLSEGWQFRGDLTAPNAVSEIGRDLHVWVLWGVGVDDHRGKLADHATAKLRKVALAIARYSRTLVTMDMSAREAVGIMDAALAGILNDVRARHGQRWPEIWQDRDTGRWWASRPTGPDRWHHVTCRTLQDLAGELGHMTSE
jgi:hypothetical protein